MTKHTQMKIVEMISLRLELGRVDYIRNHISELIKQVFSNHRDLYF